MDYYYFIVDEVGSSDKADLRTGIRVFMMPEPMAFPPVSHPSIPRLAAYLDDGEGPYESIRQLKENSELFQALQKADPKRAAAIFEKRFLIGLDPGKYALYESTVDDEFHKLIYPLLLHTVLGSIRKNDVSGVHYFDPERIRVERLVSFDEQTKVWQAHIKVYNPNRDKWIPKRDPATFFPDKMVLLPDHNRMRVCLPKPSRIIKNKIHRYYT